MNGSDDRDVAFNGRLVKEKKKNHRKDRKKAEEGKKRPPTRTDRGFPSPLQME